MSAIEELQTAVAAVAERVGPSIVGIGRDSRGSGVVIADGQVLTNAHNLRGDEVTVDLRRRSIDDRHGRRRRRRRRPRGRHRSTRPAPRPSTWGDGAALAIGDAGLRRGGAATAAGRRVTFGLVSAIARAFRGPGGRRIDGSVEHTAPARPGLVRWGARRRGGPARRPQHQPDRRGLLSRAPGRCRAAQRGSMRSAAASRRRAARLGVAIAPSHVARRLRRSVGLPERDGVLVRGVEDGSPAEAAGIEAGDLIVAAAGRDIADARRPVRRARRGRGAVRGRARARRRGADRHRRSPGRTNAGRRVVRSPGRPGRTRGSARSIWAWSASSPGIAIGSSVGAVVALVVANAIPLIGVLFFGWSVWTILIVYWLENGIVGVFNVLKMARPRATTDGARPMRRSTADPRLEHGEGRARSRSSSSTTACSGSSTASSC